MMNLCEIGVLTEHKTVLGHNDTSLRTSCSNKYAHKHELVLPLIRQQMLHGVRSKSLK